MSIDDRNAIAFHEDSTAFNYVSAYTTEIL